MEIDPPLKESYEFLLKLNSTFKDQNSKLNNYNHHEQLPIIDLNELSSSKREKCKRDICEAAREWGFLQVINHGIPIGVLKKMRHEEIKVFHQPFNKKNEEKYLNLPTRSCYRWGNPKATCLRQLPWSEAFHIPLTDISFINHITLRECIEEFSNIAATLAKTLAEILASNLGLQTDFFEENCVPRSCYVRMNRYLPCPSNREVFGLMPHTDSDFLTVLHQDHVGGLQLMKNGRWFGVKPDPDALVINIGDLFQAWSNDAYKSIKHRVMAPEETERYSVAFFYGPPNDTVIESCLRPTKYRKFSFGDYKLQTLKDVEITGDKIGLSRFLL